MIRAMVFDLDGTLVQTEKLKALSYARAAIELDGSIAESAVVEAFREVVGRSRHEVARHLVETFGLEERAAAERERFGVQQPWQAYVQIRLGFYEEMLADESCLLRNQWPHNVALLRYARSTCRQVGLASMSHCDQVRRVLRVLGLHEMFDFVASRDDVEHGKPDPEIYELMTTTLGREPAECLAIEDSVAGVRAALAAGLHCVAAATPFTGEALAEADLLPPERIVTDPDRVWQVVEHVLNEARTGRGDIT
ncbi:MAG: HAD family phosphatase [Gemmatimonadota bacterium]|nr:HAD family phosphatase [Gemmatimonadota bacterium]